MWMATPQVANTAADKVMVRPRERDLSPCLIFMRARAFLQFDVGQPCDWLAGCTRDVHVLVARARPAANASHHDSAAYTLRHMMMMMVSPSSVHVLKDLRQVRPQWELSSIGTTMFRISLPTI